MNPPAPAPYATVPSSRTGTKDAMDPPPLPPSILRGGSNTSVTSVSSISSVSSSISSTASMGSNVASSNRRAADRPETLEQLAGQLRFMAPSQNTGIGTAHHHLHTPTTTPVNHQHSHHCSDHRMQLQEDLVKNWMKFMGSEMEILEQKLADETGARLALESQLQALQLIVEQQSQMLTQMSAILQTAGLSMLLQQQLPTARSPSATAPPLFDLTPSSLRSSPVAPAKSAPTPSGPFEVVLQRHSSTEEFGLVIRGGKGSSVSACAYIHHIVPNTCAARSGAICLGDKVLEINDQNVAMDNGDELMARLITPTNTLRLRLSREPMFLEYLAQSGVTFAPSPCKAVPLPKMPNFDADDSLLPSCTHSVDSSMERRVRFAPKVKGRMFLKEDLPEAVGMDDSFSAPLRSPARSPGKKLATTAPSSLSAAVQAVEASVTKAETDEQENKPAREAAITTVEPASQIAENRNQEALMAAFVREVEAEHPQFTIISAVLRKKDYEVTLGLSVKNGESGAIGVIIEAIREDSAAGRTCVLQPNDQILGINEVDMRYLPCEDVVACLREAGNHVRLVVGRSTGSAPIDAMETTL